MSNDDEREQSGGELDPARSVSAIEAALTQIRTQLQSMRRHIAQREQELDAIRGEYDRLVEKMRTLVAEMPDAERLLAFLLSDDDESPEGPTS